MAGRFRWAFGTALAAVAVAWLVGLPRAAADPPPPAGNDHPSNALCLVCHSRPGLVGRPPERPLKPVEREAFQASAHGQLECVSCHERQSALPHPEVIRQASASRAIVLACARCHQGAYKGYVRSVHGVMVDLRDDRGPACEDCHGPVHQIKPVDQWTKEDKTQACGECHPGAGPGLLGALLHKEPSSSFLPAAYFAGRFLMLLTAGVLAFGVIHVELELLRWLARRGKTHS
ncbi:MAG TPA: hypothetical protein VFT91_08845 [Dehalococcoidia bacterium]|nr:hypothetical protein [Dehalococcoidia bacterium]